MTTFGAPHFDKCGGQDFQVTFLLKRRFLEKGSLTRENLGRFRLCPIKPWLVIVFPMFRKRKPLWVRHVRCTSVGIFPLISSPSGKPTRRGAATAGPSAGPWRAWRRLAVDPWLSIRIGRGLGGDRGGVPGGRGGLDIDAYPYSRVCHFHSESSSLHGKD